MVLHGEDASPGGTSVVDDGFRIQRFDCEGVDDPDGDPLCKETSSHSWESSGDATTAAADVMALRPGRPCEARILIHNQWLTKYSITATKS